MMTGVEEGETGSPLRIRELVAESYRSCWAHRRNLALLAWPVMLVGAVETAMSAHDLGQPGAMTLTSKITGAVVVVAFLLVWLPLLGGACRLFISGRKARADLHWRNEEWLLASAVLRVTGVGMVVVGCVTVAAGLLMTVLFTVAQLSAQGRALFEDQPATTAIAVVVLLPFLLIAGGFVYRYILIIPAASLGLRMTLRESKATARAAGFKLLVASILAELPFVLCQLALLAMMGSFPESGIPQFGPHGFQPAEPSIGLMVTISLVNNFLGIIGGLLWVGVIASAWRTLGGGIRQDVASVPAEMWRERG